MVLVIVKMAPSIINSAILLSDVSFVSMNLSNFELINRDLYDCLMIVSVLLLIMGMVILFGKGDNLIAGYNTASKEEMSQYNIKRLRGLIGGMLILLAPLTVIMLGKESMIWMSSYVVLNFVLCIVVLILANSWAKTKKK